MNYITNSVLDHGMGSRVLKIILLMGYSNYAKDAEFVYTPLSFEGDGVSFNHNQLRLYKPTAVKNEREEYLELCSRWDKTLNIGGLTINEIDRGETNPLVHPIVPTSSMELLEYFNGENRNKIINKFNLPEKIEKPYVDVAIHIRRGDVAASGIHADRWLTDEYYLNIISVIESTLGDKCRVTIYTQRGNFNATLYSKYDIMYDDETLDNDIWVKLINSDILVMGMSSYSYSSALLSTGLCVYTPNHICGPKICENWVLPSELKNKLEKYEK